MNTVLAQIMSQLNALRECSPMDRFGEGIPGFHKARTISQHTEKKGLPAGVDTRGKLANECARLCANESTCTLFQYRFNDQGQSGQAGHGNAYTAMCALKKWAKGDKIFTTAADEKRWYDTYTHHIRLDPAPAHCQ